MVALDKYTIKTLNNLQNSFTLLNTKMTQKHKQIILNKMAIDNLQQHNQDHMPLLKQNVASTLHIVIKV